MHNDLFSQNKWLACCKNVSFKTFVAGVIPKKDWWLAGADPGFFTEGGAGWLKAENSGFTNLRLVLCQKEDWQGPACLPILYFFA